MLHVMPCCLLLILLVWESGVTAYESDAPRASQSGEEPVSAGIAALRQLLVEHGRANEVAALRQLLVEHGRANSSSLLEHARALQSGVDGRVAKQPAVAAKLFAALAAANQTGAVSIDDAAGAAVALGRMHLQGEGVRRDAERARDLFERAADLGHPEAQFALGVLYVSATPMSAAPDPHVCGGREECPCVLRPGEARPPPARPPTRAAGAPTPHPTACRAPAGHRLHGAG